jgi:sugar fermentation stimulation protein A
LYLKWDNLAKAVFLRRVNRFKAEVEVAGKRGYAFVPNPSPLKELLRKGGRILLVPKGGRGKTAFDLLAVQAKNVWVTIDSRLPNKVFKEAVLSSELREFKGYRIKKENVRVGKSLVDFLLEKEGRVAYVEVKSCSLAIDKVALFPDAPTERGRKHLRELIEVKRKGHQAYIVWIVQRPDAEELRPYEEKDERFALALKEAVEEGVIPIAYVTEFDGALMKLRGRIPVRA